VQPGLLLDPGGSCWGCAGLWARSGYLGGFHIRLEAVHHRCRSSGVILADWAIHILLHSSLLCHHNLFQYHRSDRSAGCLRNHIFWSGFGWGPGWRHLGQQEIIVRAECWYWVSCDNFIMHWAYSQYCPRHHHSSHSHLNPQQAYNHSPSPIHPSNWLPYHFEAFNDSLSHQPKVRQNTFLWFEV